MGATEAAAPSKPPLAAVALTATEVGAGYARRLYPGGMHMKATVKGKQLAASSVAVYQARGDVLSALYSHTGTDAAQSRLTLRKAQTSAAKLKRLS
jgi:hypothetical protein